MASWSEFEATAPGLAEIANERFGALGVLLVGTIRKDGSPRVTPIEYMIIDGEFYTGGMWQSKKCLDMERDPRVVFHSAVTQKTGAEGDMKVYGDVISITDPAERQRLAQAEFERSGYRPEEPWHVFRLDIRDVGFVVFGEGIAKFRERIESTPAVQIQRRPEDPNTTGYLVATWKA